jgi:hypothetical protein
MSKITNIISAALGLALVKRFSDRVKDEPAAKKIVPTGFTLGPAAASMDIAPLIPKGAFKITPTQLTAFTPERKVTIPKYDPGVPVAQPIAKGKVIPLGLREGETTDDLLRRLFR